MIHRLASAIEDFPRDVAGSVVRAAKSIPSAAARRVHLFARRVCGCHHETAAGCALYRKGGPDRCECACHAAAEAKDTRTVTYTFTATGHEEVRAALNDVATAARKLRETPLQVGVIRERAN